MCSAVNSHRGVAAVDEQQRAGHVRGVVRREKQDARGDFLRRAVTPEECADPRLGGLVLLHVARGAARVLFRVPLFLATLGARLLVLRLALGLSFARVLAAGLSRIAGTAPI